MHGFLIVQYPAKVKYDTLTVNIDVHILGTLSLLGQSPQHLYRKGEVYFGPHFQPMVGCLRGAVGLRDKNTPFQVLGRTLCD